VKNAALKSRLNAHAIEAGVDEAGRGCLAGPVVAAAVILPSDFSSLRLDDSKKLSEALRNSLREEILNQALAWGIGIATVDEIDKINILNATYLAMHRAVQQLHVLPQHLLIDGNRFKPFPGIEHTCVVGGDGKYLSIAAAAVLAKTTRDQMMKSLHEEFPVYDWNKNKGYGTMLHRSNIRRYGVNEHHRKSFRLLPDQLSLFDARDLHSL
jgi:ribonuclease HII